MDYVKVCDVIERHMENEPELIQAAIAKIFHLQGVGELFETLPEIFNI